MTQHNHKKGGYLNKMEANYGFLSVIPAILVIVLALKTKKTLLSLMIGGFVGAVILNGFNPLIALPNMIQYDVFPSIEGNAGTLVLVTIAGGFVNLIKSSGAAKALGDFAAKHIHSKKGPKRLPLLPHLHLFIQSLTSRWALSCVPLPSVSMLHA